MQKTRLIKVYHYLITTLMYTKVRPERFPLIKITPQNDQMLTCKINHHQIGELTQLHDILALQSTAHMIKQSN